MVDLMHHLTNLLFFGIPFLYYYINPHSSIISYNFINNVFLVEIYLSFGISSLATFECGSRAGFFEILVILSTIKLPTRCPIASAVF